ncbi:hypothetical protein VPHK397_0147 [Vibrio phage K397]
MISPPRTSNVRAALTRSSPPSNSSDSSVKAGARSSSIIEPATRIFISTSLCGLLSRFITAIILTTLSMIK